MSDSIVLRVVVDPDRITIGDFVLIEKFQHAAAARRKAKNGKVSELEFSMAELVEFLDRVVEGGVRSIPAKDFPLVMEEIGLAMKRVMGQASGGDDPEKNS